MIDKQVDYFEINWQIEKVVSPLVVLIDILHQQLSVVFIRDVFDHNRRLWVQVHLFIKVLLSISPDNMQKYFVDINFIKLRILLLFRNSLRVLPCWLHLKTPANLWIVIH